MTHPGRDVRMAELAEWMANASPDRAHVKFAAKALGWTYDSTKHVWRRICKRMGAQAI